MTYTLEVRRRWNNSTDAADSVYATGPAVFMLETIDALLVDPSMVSFQVKRVEP